MWEGRTIQGKSINLTVPDDLGGELSEVRLGLDERGGCGCDSSKWGYWVSQVE